MVSDYNKLSALRLAGAGGIEPPNGGIKIGLIIQRFQRAFGKKKGSKCPLAISIAWPPFPNKEAAVAGRISLAKSEATGCARADREGHGVDSTCEFDQHAVARHPAEVARVRQVGGIDL